MVLCDLSLFAMYEKFVFWQSEIKSLSSAIKSPFPITTTPAPLSCRWITSFLLPLNLLRAECCFWVRFFLEKSIGVLYLSYIDDIYRIFKSHSHIIFFIERLEWSSVLKFTHDIWQRENETFNFLYVNLLNTIFNQNLLQKCSVKTFFV